MVKLWEHQRQIVDFMKERNYGLVGAGMRTGKTLAALTYINETYQDALVITTKKGIKVWKDEYNDHFGIDGILALDQKSTIAKIAAFKDAYQPPIVVINYDSLWRDGLYQLLLRYPFDVIIADEGHYLKGNNTNVSKAAYYIGRNVKNRFILTGTPMPNSPLDIFGQARFLNDELFTFNGVRLLKAFYKFQARYANLYDVAPNVKAVSSYKNLAELNAEMKKFTIRIDTAEVFELPKETHTYKYVSLPEQAREWYDHFASELILETKDAILTADNILVKSIKLQQIAGGFVWDDNKNVFNIHSNKLQTVWDIIDTQPSRTPFVIFAKFKPEVRAINRYLSERMFTVSVLDGEVNQLEDWQNGETQILVVQIDTGAEAISLVRAHHVIYYSTTYSLGKFEQSLMRVNGPKQKADHIYYYYIVASNTIEEDIYDALKDKADVKAKVLKGILSYKRKT